MSYVYKESPELKVHKAIAQYLRVLEKQGRLMFFAVPNEGKRTLFEQTKRKAEGMRAGVSDIIIVLDAGKTLFIEVKAPATYKISDKTGKRIIDKPAGAQQDTQKMFQRSIEEFGHIYYLAYSVDDMVAIVKTHDI